MTSARLPKKRVKKLAVIFVDLCTGCEACVAVCPVHCISLITQEMGVKGTQSWCEVDLEHCIGCELCVHNPPRSTDTYTLTVCPWGAIEMLDMGKLVRAVEELGGPPEYRQANRDRLRNVARRLVEESALLPSAQISPSTPAW